MLLRQPGRRCSNDPAVHMTKERSPSYRISSQQVAEFMALFPEQPNRPLHVTREQDRASTPEPVSDSKQTALSDHDVAPHDRTPEPAAGPVDDVATTDQADRPLFARSRAGSRRSPTA